MSEVVVTLKSSIAEEGNGRLSTWVVLEPGKYHGKYDPSGHPVIGQFLFPGRTYEVVTHE